MKRFAFVSVLGFAALSLTTPAGAQVTGLTASSLSYADDARQPYYQARRAAYDNGYREGLKEGEKEGRKRDSFDYRDERTWQRADKGYNRSFGDIDRYREQFRAGYAAGYSEAYQHNAPSYGYGGNGRAVPRRDTYGYPNQYPGTQPGYPNGYPTRGTYPGNYPYGSSYNAAYPNGVNDGYEKGQEDARKRRSYDPLRHDWYRAGDHDYRSEYGSKDQYRNVYRDGFKEGYDRGYREGTYR
jgi:flagellar biosynthesis/type III secretory pathway protein FliH